MQLPYYNGIQANRRRFVRDTIAAQKIERVGRGMLGRRKWMFTFHTAKAVMIQKVFRGRLGRRRAAHERWHRMQLMFFVRKRFNQHRRRTRHRKKAIQVVQRVCRGWRGRQIWHYFKRVQATIDIQKWVRRIWANRWILRFVRSVVLCQTFTRRIRGRLLQAKTHASRMNDDLTRTLNLTLNPTLTLVMHLTLT